MNATSQERCHTLSLQRLRSSRATSQPRRGQRPPLTQGRRGDIADPLRAEVDELRSRLEATEAAKALVEARLAALDATTTHIASNRLGGDDLRARINDLEGQVQGVPPRLLPPRQQPPKQQR